MENSEVLGKILQVLESRKMADGWTDLASAGKPLMDLGVNYKAEGYPKLRDFLEAFPAHIELKVDSSHATPVYYAKAAEDNGRQNSSQGGPRQ